MYQKQRRKYHPGNVTLHNVNEDATPSKFDSQLQVNPENISLKRFKTSAKGIYISLRQSLTWPKVLS